ncbi:hypothetical protein H253_3609 [Klebsiella pneumoniae KP-7]|nr:hypothetical protein H253_3609 [Klebsiella pneumoniae KP-7]EOZ63968.1 hypothetical protein H254_3315 [Klebsiella pneumoniae KP-11]CDL20181.1 hypothetical protein [Klebsiella pneumoniae IS53]
MHSSVTDAAIYRKLSNALIAYRYTQPFRESGSFLIIQ